jgi:hypothetical protein
MTIFKERLEWDAKIDSLVKSMAFDCRMVCLTMREKGADKKYFLAISKLLLNLDSRFQFNYTVNSCNMNNSIKRINTL